MIMIVDIGMNHETAPVELRELVAFGGHNIDEVMNSFRGIENIKEFMVLSTCNRVEILFTTDMEKEAKESVIEFLSHVSGIKKEESNDCPFSARPGAAPGAGCRSRGPGLASGSGTGHHRRQHR